MTLRRSSRAPPPAHSNSSSLSSRDRTTRSNNKASSPQKSASPGSLSSDDGNSTGRTHQSEETQTRRRTRAQDIEQEEAAKMDEELDEEVGDDEEETTRCICGFQEYPGPPSDDEDLAVGSDLQAEDVGGLFIQCDKCKVWQHGGCVGIMEEKAVPENYFCEDCRKDLHKLLSSPKGQKYSHYIPVVGDKEKIPSKSARKSSISKESETKTSKDKDKPSRASVEAFTKRRSTMNSRAAYDEDEVLRKVLEESKGEGGSADSDSGTRKGKRVRDESEDVKQGIKRQRTGSGSSSSPGPSDAPDSDDEGRSKSNSASQKQKPRGAAARSQQERLLREQKEREKERAEAAGKRKGRAERRRAEDVEPEPTRETGQDAEQLETETPAVNQTRETPTAPPTTSKKSGRGGGLKRGGNRVGRNQYTRDRDITSTDRPPSPHRTVARNKDKEDEGSPANGVELVTNGSGSDAPANGRGPKNGKKMGFSKLDKISWKDMNGTASHMLEYISRVQVEMASEKTNTTASAMAVVKTLQAVNGDSNSVTPTEGNHTLVKDSDGKEEKYEGLNSLEMMDVLTRNLVLWQQRFSESRER